MSYFDIFGEGPSRGFEEEEFEERAYREESEEDVDPMETFGEEPEFSDFGRTGFGTKSVVKTRQLSPEEKAIMDAELKFQVFPFSSYIEDKDKILSTLNNIDNLPLKNIDVLLAAIIYCQLKLDLNKKQFTNFYRNNEFEASGIFNVDIIRYIRYLKDQKIC